MGEGELQGGSPTKAGEFAFQAQLEERERSIVEESNHFKVGQSLRGQERAAESKVHNTQVFLVLCLNRAFLIAG